MRTVAFIYARANSQRLPGKAMMQLDGKPIVEWQIQALQASGICDDIVVSSDGEDILEAADYAGAMAIPRNPDLCEEPPGFTVIKNVRPAVIEQYRFITGYTERFIDVLVQGVIFTPEIINKTVDHLQANPDLNTVFTATRTLESHPYYLFRDKGDATQFLYPGKMFQPSQNFPPVYRIAIGVQATWTDCDGHVDPRGFVEIEESDYFELHTPDDWSYLQYLWPHRMGVLA